MRARVNPSRNLMPVATGAGRGVPLALACRDQSTSPLAARANPPHSPLKRLSQTHAPLSTSPVLQVGTHIPASHTRQGIARWQRRCWGSRMASLLTDGRGDTAHLHAGSYRDQHRQGGRAIGGLWGGGGRRKWNRLAVDYLVHLIGGEFFSAMSTVPPRKRLDCTT